MFHAPIITQAHHSCTMDGKRALICTDFALEAL
jgi:hypothetical protein